MGKKLIGRYLAIGLIGSMLTFYWNMSFTREHAYLWSFIMTVIEIMGTIICSYVVNSFIKLDLSLWIMLSTGCSLIFNTFLLLLLEYFHGPKPHKPLWEEMERFPVLIIAVGVAMIPLVITVSYSAAQIIKTIRQDNENEA